MSKYKAGAILGNFAEYSEETILNDNQKMLVPSEARVVGIPPKGG